VLCCQSEPIASSHDWPIFAEEFVHIFSENSNNLSGEGIYELSRNVEIVFELVFVIKMWQLKTSSIPTVQMLMPGDDIVKCELCPVF
jgi:hypothetical protein